ncbi:uncharacterized protein LOC122722457 [Manihot esculenta]|uniref:uncharacterized protein LOC122722457 n=1 Tax=Manihot esculenta TaxID=3983 RepID=UPI001CC76522|nr:uncharacterized protein LOC122722457 [Manihot esculenta]
MVANYNIIFPPKKLSQFRRKYVRLQDLQRLHKKHGHLAQVLLDSPSSNQWPDKGHNRAILQGLKKRLDGAKKNGAAKLNSILWAFRTTSRTPTKKTPFALAFGIEAVVPIELQIPTHRFQFNNEDSNSDKLKSNLDALEEIREEGQVRATAYQQKAARYYNQKVRERSLKVGDLALRKLEATRKRAVVQKLALTWEGPFRITKVVKPGVYRIEDLQGNLEPHACNIQYLKGYFP